MRNEVEKIWKEAVVTESGYYALCHLTMLSVAGLQSVDRMINDCGPVGGMKIGRGNRNTRTKPASIPLCPPQIPHDLNWDRIRNAAVGHW
jgi:hypothetical protein